MRPPPKTPGASFCYREGEAFWELMEVRLQPVAACPLLARIGPGRAAACAGFGLAYCTALSLRAASARRFRPVLKRPPWPPQVRAFGLFIRDVVARLDAAAASSPAAPRLRALAERCAAAGAGRPRFAQVEAELRGIE